MTEALDIGIDKLMEVLRERGLPDGLSLEERRARMEDIGDRFPAPESAKVEAVEIAGRPAEWVYDPEADDGRVMLYVHGGGYVQGSLHTHRNMVYEIARAFRGRVLNLDYRLAPEHPYPGAVDDMLAAWQALLESGVDPAKAAWGGDSAGGGLVVATLMRARDEGVALPACASCLSPWIDLIGTGQTMSSKADEDPMVGRGALEFFADLYANGQDKTAPYMSPLFGSYAGLPPIQVHVGTAETLLDDSRRLAVRARHAGVDLDYSEWEGMPHIWHIFCPLLQKSRDAIADIGAFVVSRTA